MDKDGNLPEWLRLPHSLAESGDPIEGNPYPKEHPAYQVWIDATRRAEGEVCRIDAEASSSLTPANADNWLPALAVSKFDVWARRGVKVVWTDAAMRQYDRWLLDYANAWIEDVSRCLTAHPPPFPPELVLTDLRRRLGARVVYWKAESRRYRSLQEAHAAAAVPAVPRVPSGELVKRRRHLVQKHRGDHGFSASGFAQRVGISESAIRGIVREDWTRFNRATQDRLLTAINVTREEWYRE